LLLRGRDSFSKASLPRGDSGAINTDKRLAVLTARIFVPPMPVAFRFAIAAILGLACTRLLAGEPAAWLSDRSEAAAIARKQGRLLLFVQLSGDFTKSAADAPESQLYQRLILSNPRVAEALAGRFAISYELVGEAKSMPRLASPAGKPAGGRAAGAAGPKFAHKPPEMAIAYFCLPDQRVLHLLPGFVSPEEFLAELEWVEQVYSRLAKAGEAELTRTLRIAHREMLDAKDLELLANQFPSRWANDAEPPDYSIIDLPQTLAASRAVWDWAQGQRLGIGRSLNLRDPLRRTQLVARSGTLSGLAAHGRWGPDFAHLVLAEFPLAYLSDLAGPVYESCTGQRSWHISPRRSEIAKWWAACAKQGRRTMLIVASEATDTSTELSQSEQLADQQQGNRPPQFSNEDAIELAELWRVASRVVTIDELAALITDVELPPLAYHQTVGPPRFILHDARGVCCGELAAAEATAERLATVLRTIVGGAAQIIEGPNRVGRAPGDLNEGESDAKP
jgi:hypothetical protein